MTLNNRRNFILQTVLTPRSRQNIIETFHIPYTESIASCRCLRIFKVERGDIFGFMAIVGLFRRAAINNDVPMAVHHIINAHRALASVGRLPLFGSYWKQIASKLYRLQKRYDYGHIFPDLREIEKIIQKPRYVTNIRTCPRRNSTSSNHR